MGKKNQKNSKSVKQPKQKVQIAKGKNQKELAKNTNVKEEVDTKSENIQVDEDSFAWLKNCDDLPVSLIDVDKVEMQTQKSLFDSLLL